MTRTYANLDADESVFFSRQLEYVKTKTYDRQFPELLARSLFPVNNEIPRGAKKVSYKVYSRVGLASIVSNYTTDLPRIDLVADEFEGDLKLLGASYGYSLEEVWASQQFGTALETRKAAATKQAILSLEDDIAVSGDSDHNLIGLLSHPNVPDVAIPANGSGSSSLWSTKTADQIIADINSLVTQIVSTTKGVEQPNTLLLSTTPYMIASSLRVGDSGKTVLDFVKSTSPYIKDIILWAKLDGKGSGGTDVMVAYNRNPDKLELMVAQDFEQLEADKKGLAWDIDCVAKTGGLSIYYPLSVAKADGI